MSESGTHDAPFVGQARPLAQLWEAARASREHAVVALLSGPPGRGKSRLAEEVIGVLGEHALVLRGRSHAGAVEALSTLAEPVEQLALALAALPRAELLAVLPPDLDLAARLFPALALHERGGAAADPPAQPVQARRAAGRALRGLLANVAQRRPVVLLLEHLQLGDADSAAVLAELLRPPSAPRLLLVGAHDADVESGAPLAAIRGLRASYGHDLDLRRIELAALSRDEATELADHLAPGDQARARRIAELADGSPLAVELLGQLATLPAAVTSPRALLTQRIAALADDAAALLRVLAAAARPLPRAIAVEAAALDAPRALAALAELRAAGLVRARADARELECRHQEIPACVAESSPPEALALAHRGIARALAGDGRPHHAARASHALAGADREAVLAHAPSAAAEASERLAFARAARWLDAALAAGPPPELLRELRGRLADALSAAGEGAQAAQVLLGAAAGASAADALQHRRRAADLLIASGRARQGVVVLEQTLAASGMTLVLSTWLVIGLYLLEQLRLRLRGLRWNAVDPSRGSAEPLQRIDLCYSAGVSLAAVHPTAARIWQARHLRLALAAGDEGRIALGLALNATTSAILGGGANRRSEALLARLAPLAARLRDPHVDAWIAATHGMIAYLDGEWRAAARQLDTAEGLLRAHALGSPWELATMHTFASIARFHLGELAELWRRLPSYEHEAREIGDRYALTNVRIGVTNSRWLARDAPLVAAAEIDAAMADWGSAQAQLQQYYELVARVQIDLYAGHGAAALRRVDATWRALEDSLLLRLDRVGIEACHLRARAALAAYEELHDERLLARAALDARALARRPRRWAQALGALVTGAIRAARGDRLGGAAELAQAAVQLEERSMRVWAAAARRRSGELRGGPEGLAMVAAADAFFTEQAIRVPRRWAAMLVPGVDGAVASGGRDMTSSGRISVISLR